MITVDDLRFVETLVRTGSFSAAARSFNVMPPAPSMRLEKLEQSFGIASLEAQFHPKPPRA